jgi:hypothetical protein
MTRENLPESTAKLRWMSKRISSTKSSQKEEIAMMRGWFRSKETQSLKDAEVSWRQLAAPETRLFPAH